MTAVYLHTSSAYICGETPRECVSGREGKGRDRKGRDVSTHPFILTVVGLEQPMDGSLRDHSGAWF